MGCLTRCYASSFGVEAIFFFVKHGIFFLLFYIYASVINVKQSRQGAFFETVLSDRSGTWSVRGTDVLNADCFDWMSIDKGCQARGCKKLRAFESRSWQRFELHNHVSLTTITFARLNLPNGSCWRFQSFPWPNEIFLLLNPLRKCLFDFLNIEKYWTESI